MMRKDQEPGGLITFAIRTGTAAIIGVLVLAAVLFGGRWGLAVLIALISMLAVSELYSFTRRDHPHPTEAIGVLSAGAMALATAQWGHPGLLGVLAAMTVLFLIRHVALGGIRTADTAVTMFGATYVGFLLSHFVMIRQLDASGVFALATIISVWANDVFAYLVGSTVGMHKMAPRISPKKSWEGFAAGTVFTTAVWVSLMLIPDVSIPALWLFVIGLGVSLAAVLGDLAESRLKREAGVKDSGTLLPGHGGVLDRFDSLILVSPVAYYLLLLAGVS